VLVYGAVLGVIVVAVAVSLTLRAPFKVDVVRDRTSLGRLVEDGHIENVYRLQVMNATESRQRYLVEVSGIDGITVAAGHAVEIGPAEARWLPVAVRIPPQAAQQAGAHRIHFRIERAADAHHAPVVVEEPSTFVVPR
jgi:polyferredoxin